MGDVRFDELDPGEQQEVVRDEARWRRAHEIVRKHPHLDVSDVHHTLVNLERTPEERLRRGLTHGKLRRAASAL